MSGTTAIAFQPSSPLRHASRVSGRAQVNTPATGTCDAPAACSRAESDPTKQAERAITAACASRSVECMDAAAPGSWSRPVPTSSGNNPSASSMAHTARHVAPGSVRLPQPAFAA